MTDPRRSPENLRPNDQSVLRIGTRGSPLALVQARQIAAALEVVSGGAIRGEIVTFTTSGDKLTTERLINSGGKGLFTRELDEALDRGDVDVTVHSLKDVPAVLPDGQMFVCFPDREDAREGFLSARAASLADLPKGARVGTASLRREAQTLSERPDLNIVTFRGNVATRMRKLDEGQAEATYLAMAGLTRLDMAHLATPIPLDEMLPAAAQGIVGVVARDMLSDEARIALARMTSPASETAAIAERAFLAALDGSCRTPIAAHLFDRGDRLELKGEVLAINGAQVWRSSGTVKSGASAQALAELGRSVAADILEAAGGELPAFRDE